jgi:peptidoglycan/LPS O-acetylase OafA/YrhL
MDFIRAVMMLLGVVLHTALVFQEQDGLWIYYDPERSPLAVLFPLSIHIFRMPIFFVMAGFFGAMLFTRKGPAIFAGHRFDRIVIPLVIGWFVLYPLLMWAISFAYTYASQPVGGRSILDVFSTMTWNADFVEESPDFFAAWPDFVEAGPMHLWFLYYLVYYYVFFALSTLFLRKFARRLVLCFSRCVHSLSLGAFRWLRLPLLMTISFPLMLTMDVVGFDTPMDWFPLWNVLGAYAVYFGVGWVCYRHREIVRALERFAWTRLVAGLVFLMVAMVLSMIWYLPRLTTDTEPLGGEDLSVLFVVTQVIQVISIWLLVFGLTGVCERLFRKENRTVRYLVDASYWIYLMHLPLTIFIPACFRYWDIDGTIKMFVMMILVTIPLLITYHFLVRGTVLGIVLSGRRYAVWPLTGRNAASTE